MSNLKILSILMRWVICSDKWTPIEFLLGFHHAQKQIIDISTCHHLRLKCDTFSISSVGSRFRDPLQISMKTLRLVQLAGIVCGLRIKFSIQHMRTSFFPLLNKLATNSHCFNTSGKVVVMWSCYYMLPGLEASLVLQQDIRTQVNCLIPRYHITAT